MIVPLCYGFFPASRRSWFKPVLIYSISCSLHTAYSTYTIHLDRIYIYTNILYTMCCLFGMILTATFRMVCIPFPARRGTCGHMGRHRRIPACKADSTAGRTSRGGIPLTFFMTRDLKTSSKSIWIFLDRWLEDYAVACVLFWGACVFFCFREGIIGSKFYCIDHPTFDISCLSHCDWKLHCFMGWPNACPAGR